MRILEDGWNPDTASAYGVTSNKKEKKTPQKSLRRNDLTDKQLESTRRLREKSKESLRKMNESEKERLQKVGRQLNDEVSRAFDDMANILDKYD